MNATAKQLKRIKLAVVTITVYIIFNFISIHYNNNKKNTFLNHDCKAVKLISYSVNLLNSWRGQHLSYLPSPADIFFWVEKSPPALVCVSPARRLA